MLAGGGVASAGFLLIFGLFCVVGLRADRSTIDGDAPAGFAMLTPTSGHEARGWVELHRRRHGVEVVARVQGLAPGHHGFHVHERGDCSATDASSAGGHFAPRGMPHGGPQDERRHVGDLGNIVADASGAATLRRVDEYLALEGPRSVLGRAVVVHAGRDDLESEPSGNAGARVACGVIKAGDP